MKYEVTQTRGGAFKLYYRIVWSTAYEREVITDELAAEITKLAEEIAEDKGFQIIEFDILEHHYVDCIVSAPPKISLFDMLSWLKGITARKIMLAHPDLQMKVYKGKLWNRSYFAETIGNPTKVTVKRYLKNQSRGKNPEIHVGTGEELPGWFESLSKRESKEVDEFMD